MKNVKISFKLDRLPCYAISYKNARKTLDMQAYDGEMTVDIQYDYDRRPLRLSAKIAEGDTVEVALMPHRIELYLNGVLTDEEWPSGSRLFEFGNEISSNITACAEEYNERGNDIRDGLEFARGLLAEKVVIGSVYIVEVAEKGGEGEEYHRHGDKDRADSSEACSEGTLYVCRRAVT